MLNCVRRIYVEKKAGFDVGARNLYKDIKDNFVIEGLKSIRIINRYDIYGISDEEYERSKHTIFSEPPVDRIYEEELEVGEKDMVFAVEYLPGQYDQRADSAAQCVQMLTQNERPLVRSAKVIVLQGEISSEELKKIKGYYINPVDSREASLEKPDILEEMVELPDDVKVLEGFKDMGENELKVFEDSMGFAMSFEDLKFVQKYFREDEKRNPTITELRVIDTYWSDHCRHTTFLTAIDHIEIEDGFGSEPINKAYRMYMDNRKIIHGEHKKHICLMDMATLAMKELKKQGKLEDLDSSDEINACSIVVNVDVDGREEEWLVMFKNETHNHPTEIEPFGGAATCLGGAIRDPLSGRAYVYQAMRVTGSGDPRGGIGETLPGKLPQRKITTGAAAGYSSYGNQIGIATGNVTEIYDDGFVAKRMEIGAVIGAVPRKNVVRQIPGEGDRVILLGGRTGRDGCGGATGSSKEHTEESILTCGAEVQKGNPPTERKIQRLFGNPKVACMIKRCNDFGAGGVAVAVGELAEGLDIDLGRVLKKYEGLDGTELAISESQERMAVVVDAINAEKFIKYARMENLEAVEVARVTGDFRLKMRWRDKVIVDISRSFLNTNGVEQHAKAYIKSLDEDKNFFKHITKKVEERLSDLREAWMVNLEDINVCSQRGLVERFDSTVGAGTVLMPFGGKYQYTPSEVMASKIPVSCGETSKGTIMSFGYNPAISRWSPFHGAVYAVVEAVAKIVAAGGDFKSIRLTLQEYFEKLGKDSKRWGKPVSALLGAYYAQIKLGIPAIGGKDSMSGTFMNLDVPPTLVAFGVDVVNVNHIISPEFKKAGSRVVLIPFKRDGNELPDFNALVKSYSRIMELIKSGKILSAHTVRVGGVAEAVSKMAFGNKIGMAFEKDVDPRWLFVPDYGSIVLEVEDRESVEELFDGVEHIALGYTQREYSIMVNSIQIHMNEAQERWENPLEKIFSTKVQKDSEENFPSISSGIKNRCPPEMRIGNPKVFIPVFPGTNCEVDTARAFEKAGGDVDTFVFRNLTREDIEESIGEMVKRIKNAQIIALAGGFSAGDEPDGSGKFIATVFRNPRIRDAVMEFLKSRGGLMLGICNGFQALVKLGLLPHGEIRDMGEDSLTLTFNKIGRHMSRIVKTRVSSTLSPWFDNVSLGDIHTIPISHGEGRLTASVDVIEDMIRNGQVATQYVDLEGNPTSNILYNPNGSVYGIEGITSADGRILGKMGHSERIGSNVCKNVPGEKDQKIFEAGIKYFR